jgi:hypothetical protein
MSRVFVATEHALSRVVVVKVLRQELAADVNRERFRREIMLAAQLQHPLIVPVLSAGEHRELLWYTMPFVEGESLREEIRRGPPASARNAMRVLHDVLDALAYAHTRSVIHRDIKPGNILRHGNHSLVTDFGVAKALSAALPSSGTTSAGIAIGTPAYMAPEQLAADPSANHRMDIYAVGLLVYELLTGTQAFAESSPQATMAAQLTRMPRHLSEARPDIPPPLSALIMKMLAKSPDDRPQSATAALEELDAIVTPTGTSAPHRATAPSRRTGLLLVGLAGVVLLAGVYFAAQARLGSDTSVQTAVTGPLPPPSPGLAAPTVPAPGPRRDSLKTVTVGGAKGAAAKAPGPTGTKIADASKAGATKSGATSKLPATSTTKTTSQSPRPGVPLLNRRVAVLPFRVSSNRETVSAAAQTIHDSLQKAIAAAGYTLATDSELLRIITQQNMVSGGLRRSADAVGMGAVVMVDMSVRGAEVTAGTQVVDVWRSATSSGRDVADFDKPLELTSLIRTVLRSLDRVSWRSRSDPKTVLVFETENQTAIDSLSRFGRRLDDSLRAAVSGHGAAALPLDTLARDTKDMNERRLLAVRRGVGAMVAVNMYRTRRDTIAIRMMVRDMSEERQFPNYELRVPIDSLVAGSSQLSAKLREYLGQVNWGPKVAQ